MYRRKIRFRDANHDMWSVEIEVEENTKSRRSCNGLSVIENPLTLSMCGEGGNSCGQCYDFIVPRTEGQKHLLKFWKQFHLNDMRPGTTTQSEYLQSQQYLDDYNCFVEQFKDTSEDDRKRKYVEAWEDYQNWEIATLRRNNLSYSPAVSESLCHIIEHMKSNPVGYILGIDTYRKAHDYNDLYVIWFFLALRGMYEDRGYRYGSGWLIEPLPINITESLDEICDLIEEEEEELTEELEAVFDMGDKNFAATQEIIDKVMELRGCDEEEAEVFVALGINLGVTFGDLNDTFASHGSNRYEAFGTDYYVGTEDQLEAIATEMIRSGEYEDMWRECVHTGKTLDGFYEWGDEVIKMDGWCSILNSWDGNYSEYNVNGTYYCVSRT